MSGKGANKREERLQKGSREVRVGGECGGMANGMGTCTQVAVGSCLEETTRKGEEEEHERKDEGNTNMNEQRNEKLTMRK